MAVLNFLDVNVWLALTWSHHQQAGTAREWFGSAARDRFYFCRVTQMSLLRLLTTPTIMGEDTLTMSQAWEVYDRWFSDPRIEFLAEPPDVERHFRKFTRDSRTSPKIWADAYLAAFADTTGLRLVTFDRAFRSRDVDCLILG